jgi:hypothetical protein
MREKEPDERSRNRKQQMKGQNEDRENDGYYEEF